MRRPLALAFVAICAFTSTLMAQDESKMPKPGPEHKKLAYFVGDWTSEGEMKPSPFAPGGKFTSTDHNEWFPGEFFVMFRGTMQSPMGSMTELAVMGYNAEDQVYTYDGFSSMGEHEVSKGTVQGDTWTWNSESKFQGKLIKARFIIKEISPSSYSFKYDYSTDGNTWVNAVEGKATKAK